VPAPGKASSTLAGLPSQALDNYVTKLLAAGKKVAICDQAETAQPGRLVRRQLTRILSPGTTLSAAQLDAARNHYLCALAHDNAGLHAAWLDLSTGEFRVATDATIADLLPVLTALDPAELLVPDGALARWAAAPHDQAATHALHAFCLGRLTTELAGYHFEAATGAKTVMDTLGVLNLQGFGFAHTHPALGPAGALVYYATENLCAKPENLRGLQEYRSARTLLLEAGEEAGIVVEDQRGLAVAGLGRADDAAAERIDDAHAVQEALVALGVDRDDLVVEQVEHGDGGRGIARILRAPARARHGRGADRERRRARPRLCR
jgi:DNA mismatch repair protein MutS